MCYVQSTVYQYNKEISSQQAQVVICGGWGANSRQLSSGRLMSSWYSPFDRSTSSQVESLTSGPWPKLDDAPILNCRCVNLIYGNHPRLVLRMICWLVHVVSQVSRSCRCRDLVSRSRCAGGQGDSATVKVAAATVKVTTQLENAAYPRSRNQVQGHTLALTLIVNRQTDGCGSSLLYLHRILWFVEYMCICRIYLCAFISP